MEINRVGAEEPWRERKKKWKRKKKKKKGLVRERKKSV